jgi:hypothetical protein
MPKFASVMEAEDWCERRGARVLPRTPDGLLVIEHGARRVSASLADATWTTWESTFLELVGRLPEEADLRPPFRAFAVEEPKSGRVEWSAGRYRMVEDDEQEPTFDDPLNAATPKGVPD